jgi:glyoxylase-like metal-dependent hydrolase (beta-lactamase superfamily II)
MVDVAQFEIGAVGMTRVPYFDVALEPAAVTLTPEQVAAARDWAVPTWTTADDEVLVGQAVWVIESQGHVIVVDPCGASDPFLRAGPEAIAHQQAVLDAMSRAGFPPDRVDTVALSHLDGIGMTAVVDEDGRWAPAFPDARIVLTDAELDFLANRDDVGGLEQLRALRAQGAVDGVADDHPFTDEVAFHRTGGHSPGHAVIEIGSQGERAVLVGHLAVSPLHTSTGVCEEMHLDAPAADRALNRLMEHAAVAGSLVAGPLWPFPGAGAIAEDDHRVVPAVVG